jgi:predicted nucleic acid-binding protein
VNLVIDASAGFELTLSTVIGRALLQRLPLSGEWWVPEHYFVEVASALRRAENLGKITASQAVVAFEELRTAPLHRVQVRPMLSTAWARRGHLTIADALYVVLAEEKEATLVTADRKLANSPGLDVATITI